jgi:LDH2 family malate/lactate/ureidoglycolate dehydrogenase
MTDLFEAAGTPPDIAPIPAEHLVLANMSGYESHGVVHVTHYLDEVESGVVIPSARPRIVNERVSSVVVDAMHGWGHAAGMFALDIAMKRAAETGVAAVSIQNCPHIGRLGHYVEIAASQGFISMLTWGAGEPRTWAPPRAGYHLAVPYGGAEPTLSTNPFAFGVPTGDDTPFVLDFATTVIANAKTWVYRDRGEQMPEGCAIDRDGHPTTDPATYMDGGSLLTFGAHKGYGISLLTCLLGGLTGTYAGEPKTMDGPFLLVLDPSAFTPAMPYQEAVRSFLDGMKATPPAAGFEEVLVPGDFEARSRRHHEAEGIELSPGTFAALRAGAERLGVPFVLADTTSPARVDTAVD